jgi:hypothetical protein
MLALENRTKESRREMDILDVLEEIKDINSQKEGITFDALMDKHLEREQIEEKEEEEIVEAIVKAAFDRERTKIKRVKEDSHDTNINTNNVNTRKRQLETPTNSKSKLSNLVKRKADKTQPSVNPVGSLGLLSNYSSDDSSD